MRSVLIVGFVLSLFVKPALIFGEEAVPKISEPLVKLKAEVLETEELKEPKGAAIYTVKDLSSGETRRFFAHPYRTLVRMGNESKLVGDVLGGSKVTLIYHASPGDELPELVFVRVTSSYYS